MKILFVSRFLPHAEFHATGEKAVYHSIKSLSGEHEPSLIGFAAPQASQAIKRMEIYCRNVVAVPYKLNSILSRLWRAGWRFILPKVYGRNVSLPYYRALRRLATRTHFDVVVIDGMMAPYGLLIPSVKRILDEIDVHSQVARQTFVNEVRLLRRLALWLDWRRTKAAEMWLIRRYDGVIVRSEKDRNWLQRELPNLQVAVSTPWFEGLEMWDEIRSERPAGNNILFVGAMSHRKNVEAVTFFTREILPRIQQKIDDVVFYIVGAMPAPSIQRMDRLPNVVVTGEVEDLTPYYQMCAVNVAPLLTGGGVIAKTLNGMAAGRPTVSTVHGNAGTGALPGRDLLVVPPEPEVFADAVILLLTNVEKWMTIAQSGRNYVKENYDWTTISSDLERFLRQIRDS